MWQFKQRLKKMLHSDFNLVDFEIKRAKEIQGRLSEIPNLMLLDGHLLGPKVPVFSFLIKCGSRFLHYNYVCALLNDLFGIQSRGGCQCAGPYAQMMLGMQKHNQEVEHCLVHSKDELLRPGVTRLSLPAIGTTAEQEEYVLRAIEWVAKNGWKLMHVYRCNQRTGEWRHKSRPGAPLGKKERRWLSHYDPINSGESEANPQPQVSAAEALENADKLLLLSLRDQSSISQSLKMTDESDDSALRWYVYPKEVAVPIQKGLEVIPGSFDRELLVGALRPASWFQAEAVSERTTRQNKNDVLYRFKDGEHTGEATWGEIAEGVEDGELSDYCQVYNPESDTWELFSAILKTQQRTTLTADTPASGQGITVEPSSNLKSEGNLDADSSDSDHAAVQNETETDMLDPGADFEQLRSAQLLQSVPIIEKREKKKPSRDSTSWGQGVKKMPLSSAISSSGAALPTIRSSRSKHVKPPAKLMRTVTQAMIQWDMIQDGDRLLLVSCFLVTWLCWSCNFVTHCPVLSPQGLSGGKDSMSLLHILLEFQKKLPIRFEIEVCTIDPMTPSFDPSPLIPYVESLGLKYHYIKDEIVQRAMSSGKDGAVVKSLCAFCARMKRGNLYSCARQNNCNKLVLAQHVSIQSLFLVIVVARQAVSILSSPHFANFVPAG